MGPPPTEEHANGSLFVPPPPRLCSSLRFRVRRGFVGRRPFVRVFCRRRRPPGSRADPGRSEGRLVPGRVERVPLTAGGPSSREGRADVVDGEDARVVEGPGKASLLLEAVEASVVVAQLGGEDLDRDVASEPGVAGTVNLTHAPGTDWAADLVGTKATARGERHEPRDLGQLCARMDGSVQVVWDAGRPSNRWSPTHTGSERGWPGQPVLRRNTARETSGEGRRGGLSTRRPAASRSRGCGRPGPRPSSAAG